MSPISPIRVTAQRVEPANDLAPLLNPLFAPSAL